MVAVAAALTGEQLASFIASCNAGPLAAMQAMQHASDHKFTTFAETLLEQTFREKKETPVPARRGFDLDPLNRVTIKRSIDTESEQFQIARETPGAKPSCSGGPERPAGGASGPSPAT